MISKEKAAHGKKLIEQGVITKFSELLNILSKAALSRAMDIHENSLRSKLTDPGKITVNSIINLSDNFGVDYSRMFNLVITELMVLQEAKKDRKRKSKK